jgi:hypothetical protein
MKKNTATKTTAAPILKKRTDRTPVDRARKMSLDEAETMLDARIDRGLVFAYLAVSLDLDSLVELLGMLFSSGTESSFTIFAALRQNAHFAVFTSRTEGVEQALVEVKRVASKARKMRRIMLDEAAKTTPTDSPRVLRIVPQNGSLRDADAPAMGAA